MAARPDRGAHSIGDGGGRRRGPLLWLILGLLLLLLLLALLLSQCGDDEDTEPSGTTVPAPTQPADPAATTPGTGGAAAPEATTQEDGSAADDDGTLTADGQDLLADDVQDDQVVGQGAEGARLRVLEVVEDEGFFVGRNDDDPERVYVEFGGEVGEDEQGYRPSVGDTVDLSGEVRPAPDEPGRTLRLNAEQEQAVSDRGYFVNATSVERAGG
jgi:hypothetical protein